MIGSFCQEIEQDSSGSAVVGQGNLLSIFFSEKRFSVYSLAKGGYTIFFKLWMIPFASAIEVNDKARFS